MTKEQLTVDLTLQDISSLLAAVKADPGAYASWYWKFSEISNLANQFTGVIMDWENAEAGKADAQAIAEGRM